jgi:mannose-binding lectin 1
LWYTDSKGVEGPVFGSNDNWNGLGLFFDSFDNDNKHNNPFIMAMTNDGSQSYSHQL